MLSLSLILFILVLQFNRCHGVLNLSIRPEKMMLLTLLGEKLELTCVYEHNGPSVTLVFYKDGAEIPASISHGFISRSTSQLIGANLTIDSRTLTKQPTYVNDDGVYGCSPYAGDLFTQITVDIFSVTTVSAELPEDYWYTTVTSLEVACRFSDVSPFNMNLFTLTWEKAGTPLVNGTKYSIFENGTLLIKNPKRDNMGEYQCIFQYSPNSPIEKQEFKPQPPVVTACPAIVSHDNDINMLEGDDLELKCEVSGYPMPNVTWFKDNIKMNATIRIHFLEYKGANGKLKIFSVEHSDEGSYIFLAENYVAPYSASAEMSVIIKGANATTPGSTNAANGHCGRVKLIIYLTITSFIMSQRYI